MAWLGTWAKRVKLTIDYNDMTGSVTHFPLLVYISASSGKNTKDLSDVFTEIADVDRKKIAVAEEYGASIQYYVEIEKWDAANKQAWLWVHIDSIPDDTDTNLCLYYDKSQPDNDTYVGDKNSTPAEAVWDADFQGVYHLDESGDSGDVYDSTSNENHGSGSGGLTYQQPGKIWNGIDFDGINGKIDLGNPAGFDAANITVEAWIKTTANPGADLRIVTNGSGATNKWALSHSHIADCATMTNTTASHATAETDAVINDNAWHYLVGTTNPEAIYMDGALQSNTVTDSWSFDVNTKIGSRGATYYFDGLIDEVRISNKIRDAGWIKATYDSERDFFITYGDEENIPSQNMMLTGNRTWL